jgi:NAD(P)H-hydrate epimerase
MPKKLSSIILVLQGQKYIKKYCMKIFPVKAVAEIDAYTIENEPILSVNLMERAARKLFDFIKERYADRWFLVLAGPGNNGGDALSLSRMLTLNGFEVETVLLKSEGLSDDTQTNRDRLRHLQQAKVFELDKGDTMPSIDYNCVVIDGLFGSGLNRPLEGRALNLVQTVNNWNAEVLAIDIPSGLMGESNAGNNPDGIIKATRTYSFEFPKLSFMFPECEPYVGDWEVLPIGLHPDKIKDTPSNWFLTQVGKVGALIKPRTRFMHKGHFGHVLLIAGSYGKMGAAVLAARACMKTGAGLLTVHVPHKTCHVLHCSVPEAMVNIDRSDLMFTEFPDLSPFKAIGIGPAIGCRSNSVQGLTDLLDQLGHRRMVLDADALNILALHPALLDKLPENTVLTPHPGELKRLVGPWRNDFDRLQKVVDFCMKYKVVVVLKGAFTTVVSADGNCHFNTTGNPGMATAGSGDVLTGVILSLLGQGLEPIDAAVAGVYIHGAAGDLACNAEGEAALTASDIVNHIGKAISALRQ